MSTRLLTKILQVNLFLKEVTENRELKMREEKLNTIKMTTTTRCPLRKKKVITNHLLKKNQNYLKDHPAYRTIRKNNIMAHRDLPGKDTYLTQVNKCYNR